MTKKRKTKKTNNKKNKKNKISFFGTLFGAIKEGIKKYKATMEQEVEKHKLLSSKSDWSMIESLVQQVNSNPNLKVEVKLNDGTKILLRCYEEVPKRDFELLEVGL